MSFLLLGLILWCALHFMPVLARPLRRRCMKAIGENGYKGVFSLLMLVALGLMIVGWKQSIPHYLYTLPAFIKYFALLILVVGFVLFSATLVNTRIRSFVRHPQLSSVFLWALAHLLLNGDSRSLVLFGGMVVWCLAEIILINKRDGEWRKPEPPSSWSGEILVFGITLVVLVAMVFIHPYVAGVPIHT